MDDGPDEGHDYDDERCDNEPAMQPAEVVDRVANLGDRWQRANDGHGKPFR